MLHFPYAREGYFLSDLCCNLVGYQVVVKRLDGKIGGVELRDLRSCQAYADFVRTRRDVLCVTINAETDCGCAINLLYWTRNCEPPRKPQ